MYGTCTMHVHFMYSTCTFHVHVHDERLEPDNESGYHTAGKCPPPWGVAAGQVP